MDYKQYQKSRDASWTALIENHVSALPVKVTEIAKNYGIPCVSYEKGKDILAAYGLADRCLETDGFMMRTTDRTVIFLTIRAAASDADLLLLTSLAITFVGMAQYKTGAYPTQP